LHVLVAIAASYVLNDGSAVKMERDPSDHASSTVLQDDRLAAAHAMLGLSFPQRRSVLRSCVGDDLQTHSRQEAAG
jgi:hypothetical protein